MQNPGINKAYWTSMAAFYRQQLLGSCLPFWLRHSPDRECGGYFQCLDRDGKVYDADKICMWSQGRIAWVFAYLHNELGADGEWLEMARRGVDFIIRHGFAPDGNIYYALTRDGKPLQAPRDVSAADSAVLGFAEYAAATGDEALFARADNLLMTNWNRYNDPQLAYPAWIPETRPVRRFAHYMITLNVLQVLRRYHDDSRYEAMIDVCLREMHERFARPDRKAVLEDVAWDGGDLPGWAGRRINPGHMMEGGIFMIHEGRRRKDDCLARRGTELIDWGFQWGWDVEFGGIFNDVDVEGLPVPTVDALRYESKLWWQHTEALYAALLAYETAGEKRYVEFHDKVLAYVRERFIDPDYDEWFCMLDRTGRRVNDVKGSERKSCFHLARNMYHAWRLCERQASAG